VREYLPPFLARSVGEEGGAGGKVRAALTPSPAPALRERGELICGLGIVARRRRRIATATLISSSSAPLVGAEGGLGGRCGSTSPLPLPQRGRGRGAGGEGEGVPPASPAAWERGELVGGLGIVAGRRRRIATATLISSSSAPTRGAEGGLGGR